MNKSKENMISHFEALERLNAAYQKYEDFIVAVCMAIVFAKKKFPEQAIAATMPIEIYKQIVETYNQIEKRCDEELDCRNISF